jgi:class 3 adenylate cyclase
MTDAGRLDDVSRTVVRTALFAFVSEAVTVALFDILSTPDPVGQYERGQIILWMVLGLVPFVPLAWLVSRLLVRPLRELGSAEALDPDRALQLVSAQPWKQGVALGCLWLLQIPVTLGTNGLFYERGTFSTHFIVVSGLDNVPVAAFTISWCYVLVDRRLRSVYGGLMQSERAPARSGRILVRLLMLWLLTTGFIVLLYPLTLLQLGPSDWSEVVSTVVFLTVIFLLMGGFFWYVWAAGLARRLVGLSEAMARVRDGSLDARVPVDDTSEVGQLQSGFNDMVVGLQERATLHAAFGSYVDPALAQRLIESGSPLFEGEEVDVTVVFMDVRGFTAYSEGVSPRTAVDRLNRLFDVVVPVLQAHRGHANHYLGDGLLAVFGAPQPLQQHADEAVAAAIEVQQQVRAEFGSELQLGVGIHTGPVIAGTIGGGGRHEFTVIGDTVNAASRVESLTKETGDAILITEATRLTLSMPRPSSTQRGEFDVRGKANKLTLHAIDPFQAGSSSGHGREELPVALEAAKGAHTPIDEVDP